MSALGDAIETALRDDPRFADFERVAPARWATGPENRLCKLFEFAAMKGNRFSARWGWSVDFVPVLKGRRLAGKRTAAKAAFDLCIDPIDVSGSIADWCSVAGSDSGSRVAKIGKASFDAAIADFDRVVTLRDLTDVFQARSTMQFQRFSLDNYVQTDLAWGLALVATGQDQAGRDRLDAFCERFDVARDLPALQKAEAEARGVALALMQ
jgi:hypothetical protein